MSILDRLLGRGGTSVTVPVMDGPFLPNQKLETAEVAATLLEADNLVVCNGVLYASSRTRLMRSAGRDPFELVEEFKFPISALASSGGALAIGLNGQGILIRGGKFDGLAIGSHNKSLRCVTALAWLSEDELAVCSGSSITRPHEWRRSLMQKDASGGILKLDLKTSSSSSLMSGLAWPAGIAIVGTDLFASESWRHRIIKLPWSGGGAVTVLENLPAYPARVCSASAGGYWISFYSARNQLVEFILHEPRYRARMIAEIPEAYWMAPALSSGHSAKEPMQGSQLKQMGILKPYSASRSYGLILYCDARMTPVGSFHSRADGRRHGVIACCEHEDGLLVASKGSDAVLKIAAPMTLMSE